MSFISNYLNHLRGSDEATKHKSALSISIFASIIILAVLFLIFKNHFLSYGSVKDEVKVASTTDKIESPITSFSRFISDSGEQLYTIKSNLSSVLKKQDKKEDEVNVNSEVSTSVSSTNSVNATTSTTSNTDNR